MKKKMKKRSEWIIKPDKNTKKEKDRDMNHETNGGKAVNIIAPPFTGFESYNFNLIQPVCRIPLRKGWFFCRNL